MTAQTCSTATSDWNEWPAKDGRPAPYTDMNGNGTYEPTMTSRASRVPIRHSIMWRTT